MSSELAIVVRDLRKSYRTYQAPSDRLRQFCATRWHRLLRQPGDVPIHHREFWALHGVDFTVGVGESVGVVGRNGSGKSTLLQIVCGTLLPTTGECLVRGRIAALLELGAGFSQEFTGRENVYLNGAIYGLDRSAVDARMEEILAFADIGDFIDEPVKHYSSGMYVRLAFAVAAHIDADILVVDEALAVGDEAFQRKCYTRIERFREDGGTLLFVSHSGAVVTELCNRAILLDAGERLLTGTPRDVIAHYQRLIYAPAGRAAAIREELRALDQSAERQKFATDKIADESDPPVAAVTAGAGHGPTAIDEARGAAIDAYFDPNLKSTSAVRYARAGAEIFDIRLETEDARPVNVLVGCEHYRLRYRVLFDSSAEHVRFGMHIRTVLGTDLGGGAATLAELAAARVKANAVAEVTLRFRCVLNPGVYFMNAGVMARTGAEDSYLDRVVDALMFRVLARRQSIANGIVDFEPEGDVTIAPAPPVVPSSDRTTARR